MTNKHGEWIWFELLTREPDAAQAFYAGILGWQVEPSGMPDMDYRLLRIGGQEVGGLLRMPAGMEPGPTWLGYIGVDDVDAAAEAIVGAGGKVHMPPTTMDGVGRMAMLTDPQGVAFYVMRGASDEPSRAFTHCTGAGDAGAVGHTVWCELYAPDPDAAVAFYRQAFNWTQQGAMPMGELGEYRFLQDAVGGFGAVMRTPPGSASGWQFYFHVPDIDAAVRAINAGGGSVLQGPDEIPGGAFSISARDPQGARFGLVGPRASAA